MNDTFTLQVASKRRRIAVVQALRRRSILSKTDGSALTVLRPTSVSTDAIEKAVSDFGGINLADVRRDGKWSE